MSIKKITIVLAVLVTFIDSAALAKVTRYKLFKVHNNTGQDITALFMHPENKKSPQEYLGDQILSNGDSLSIKLELDKVCSRNQEYIYDLRAELESGGTYEETVDICDGEITLGDDGREARTNHDRNDRGMNNRRNDDFPPTHNSQGTLPTIISILNPNTPVDPSISTRITAALAAHGLSPASCSGKSLAVFKVNGAYTACAYPTANFDVGNYRMNLQGL